MIDWWILDSLRLKILLPISLYHPLSDNPFLSPFHFHFFQLEEGPEINILDFEENYRVVKNLIRKFGGTVTDTIEQKTTHVITQFQCEHLLPTQLIGPVVFVTLSWILKMFQLGKYFEPSESIDFPCPIHPIPESSEVVHNKKNYYYYYLNHHY